MTHIVGGIIAVVLGIMGIMGWWEDFGEFLRGCMPLIFLVGGLLAIGTGMRPIKKDKEAKK